MWGNPGRHEAALLTTLPESLHYRGEPTAWTQVTRPGMRLHSFLEGLVIDEHGDFFLVDVPHGRIFQVDRQTLTWRVAYQYDGEPHGLALLGGGNAVLADYRRGLLLVDLAAGTHSVLCGSSNTENFRGLSDLVRDRDGNVWFTDSGRTSLSDPSGRLYRLSASGSLRCVLDNVPYPNGVAISADGASVYIAATRANAVWRIARHLPDSGQPMAGIHARLGGGLGPDGLDVAASGLLAIAHAQAGCAWLISSLGEALARVATPGGQWTTSVRFAQDSTALYIVDAQTGSLYRYDTHTLKASP